MPDKADWVAAIRAIPRDETRDKLDRMSPRFVAAGWEICAEHRRNFQCVVLRWAQPNHPPARPELPAPAKESGPSERANRRWLYRLWLKPEELADYIAEVLGGDRADVSQADVSRLLPEKVDPSRLKTERRLPSARENERSNNQFSDAISLPVTVKLLPEEAEPPTPSNSPGYVPQQEDRRAVIHRQIRERRGQRAFRDTLRKRYKNRCLVTGCQLLDVLEAAHIRPYRGEDDNHVENGLLLRADIHTLFDLNLLGIKPEQLVVILHSTIREDAHYASLEGKILDCAADCRPSLDALRERYDQFKRSE